MDASILTGLLTTAPTAGPSSLTPAAPTLAGTVATPSFSNLLGLALGQLTAAVDTQAAADTDILALPTEEPVLESGSDAASTLAAALIASGILVQQPTPPLTPPTLDLSAVGTATVGAAATGVAPTTAPLVPALATGIPPAPVARPEQQASATEVPAPTPALTPSPELVDPPAPNPAPRPVAVPQRVAVPASSVTTAETPTAVAAVAARVPAVVAQTPIVSDRTQTLPVVPPEVGTGLVRPPVQGPTEMAAVTAVRPGEQSAVRFDVLTGALDTRSVGEVIAPVARFDESLIAARGEPDESAKSGVVPQQAVPMPTGDARGPTVSTAPLPATTSPLAGQFADALVTNARVVNRGGTHEFQMRLDPPELGEVKVWLFASGDSIRAEVLVGDDAVKRMIESQLSDLRQRLEQSGVQVSRFDVSTDTGSGTGRQPQPGDGTPWGTLPPSRPTPELPRLRPADPVAGVLDVTA